MRLYIGIVLVFLFTLVRADDPEQTCNLTALAACAEPVVIPVALAQELLTSNIIESRVALCAAIDRDGFAKLVSCASADPLCVQDIFGEGDTNPQNAVAGFSMMVKPEYNSTDKLMKILYDVICDDSCMDLLSGMDDDDMDDDGTENDDDQSNEIPEACADDYTNVQDELMRLLNVSGQTDPTQLDLPAEQWKPFCALQVDFTVCATDQALGTTFKCNSLFDVLDTTVVDRMFIAPSLEGNPLAENCPNLGKDVLDALFKTDISAADHVKYSILVIATAVAALFLQW